MGQSYVFLSMLVSTLVKTVDGANSLSYSIILANIFINCLFISTSGTMKLFYASDMKKYTYIKITTFLLEMWPIFDFTLSYGITTFKASKNFDYGGLNWLEGSHFGWEEMDIEYDFSGEISGLIIKAPSVNYFLNKIKTMAWVFFFLFIYLDHVLSSNRGVGYSFFFPFLKSYWKSVFPSLFKEELPKDDTQRLRRKVKKQTEKDMGLGISE